MNYFLFVSRILSFVSFFFILHLFLSPEHEIIILLWTRDQGHIPFIQHLRFYFFIIPLYSLPLISRALLPLCASSSSSSSSSSSFIRLRGLQQRTAHLWSCWFHFSVMHHQYPTLTGLQETCIIRAEEIYSQSKVKLYTQPNHQNK